MLVELHLKFSYPLQNLHWVVSERLETPSEPKQLTHMETL